MPERAWQARCGETKNRRVNEPVPEQRQANRRGPSRTRMLSLHNAAPSSVTFRTTVPRPLPPKRNRAALFRIRPRRTPQRLFATASIGRRQMNPAGNQSFQLLVQPGLERSVHARVSNGDAKLFVVLSGTLHVVRGCGTHGCFSPKVFGRHDSWYLLADGATYCFSSNANRVPTSVYTQDANRSPKVRMKNPRDATLGANAGSRIAP